MGWSNNKFWYPRISIICNSRYFNCICHPNSLDYNNKWKVKEKKGLVYLSKTIPILLFLMSAITLLFVDVRAVHIIASMIIGVIALPTAIWVIMSLCHKMGEKKA